MVCGQSKLKALVANIALQHTKAVEAANSPTVFCLSVVSPIKYILL